MLLFLAVGIGVIFLAHTAPFPFLLEAFRAVPIHLAHAG